MLELVDNKESLIPPKYQPQLREKANWQEIVTWVHDLPPLPHVAAKALALIEDSDVNATKLNDLLSKDAALTARILKIANSAMFARQREVTTISQAIMLIGFKALKGIIVAASVRQLTRNISDAEKLVWENAVCSAVAAQIICRKVKKDFGEEAFVLGLLHDLGKLICIRQAAGEYNTVIEKTKKGQTYREAEQEVFGCPHTVIGALVAKKWNFAETFCDVILYHHDALETIEHAGVKEKVAVIALADLIAHNLGYGHHEGYPDQHAKALAVAQTLSLESEELEKLTLEIKDVFPSANSVFVS